MKLSALAIATFIITSLCLSCKTIDPDRPLPIEHYKLSLQAADSIVLDILNIIHSKFDPKKEEFIFINQKKPFGIRLEHHLRQDGYAISRNMESTNGKWMTYKLCAVETDKNEIEKVILILYIGKRFQLNRLYVEVDGLMMTETEHTYTILK